MRIALDEEAARELCSQTGIDQGNIIPHRVIGAAQDVLKIPNLIVTHDPDGSVFIGGTHSDLPLVKITPNERQEIAAAILGALIENADVADQAPESEAGGFQRTLLVLSKLPGTREYNISALHYVLMTDITDEMLSMAVNRPVGRAMNALATLIL